MFTFILFHYLIKLYDSTSKFINRMRWKMLFHNNDDDPTETLDSKTNILKCSRSDPKCNELKEFEKDLFNLINDIKFNKYVPEFQKKHYFIYFKLQFNFRRNGQVTRCIGVSKKSCTTNVKQL